ncbi:MAG: hypothetical protein P8M60_04775, partial [Flavobacteriaceae bacterium]|nr:hypothetical protein [Flavobacteriaceae bacterium]
MMKLKDFKLLLFLIFFPVFSYAQVSVFGKVNDKQTSIGLASVEIYNELGELLATTDSKGRYQFTASKSRLTLIY